MRFSFLFYERHGPDVTGNQDGLSHPAFLLPKVVNTLAAPGKAIDDSGLEKNLIELLKLRASQLNGCAFCVISI
ncbi:carboxymuconolactone decarboxylase family protein [Klebsiella sp. RIT-PI-d]|uniref:carboxymuconolactone decarboxylase family protein n=1 Tax=Klebsiella sp. RIT-PI-d TaxID=1681196 RepID=UPI001D17005F|nr:carboxymuconolactone decarboxylase family protein [Klebsiella sp. RIT-PI-d]